MVEALAFYPLDVSRNALAWLETFSFAFLRCNSCIFSRWRRYPRLGWLLVVGLLVTIDQVSKTHFPGLLPGASVEITPWFNVVHLLNTGAAFSALADAGGGSVTF